jgi:hypothetical protein
VLIIYSIHAVMGEFTLFGWVYIFILFGKVRALTINKLIVNVRFDMNIKEY